MNHLLKYADMKKGHKRKLCVILFVCPVEKNQVNGGSKAEM